MFWYACLVLFDTVQDAFALITWHASVDQLQLTKSALRCLVCGTFAISYAAISARQLTASLTLHSAIICAAENRAVGQHSVNSIGAAELKALPQHLPTSQTLICLQLLSLG